MIKGSAKPGCIVAAALLALSGTAAAQSYPAKLIRVIVPFPPGGGSDFIVRTLNTRLPGLLGQNLIIDNRGGAGGNIGAEIVAKAPPDGYTILIGNNSLTVNASLYRKLPYDPFRDFVPIAMSGTSPNAVIVHPSLPARTGSRILHVPYKGAGPMIVDQVGGHVMLSFTALIVSKPFVDSGKLRALAVTTEKRWAGAPQIPTVAEAGYPGLDAYGWWAFFAPAGTPRAIIDRLAADIGKAMQMPDIRERFAAQGTDAQTSTPDSLAAFLKKDFELWDKLIRQLGIRLD